MRRRRPPARRRRRRSPRKEEKPKTARLPRSIAIANKSIVKNSSLSNQKKARYSPLSVNLYAAM